MVQGSPRGGARIACLHQTHLLAPVLIVGHRLQLGSHLGGPLLGHEMGWLAKDPIDVGNHRLDMAAGESTTYLPARDIAWITAALIWTAVDSGQ